LWVLKGIDKHFYASFYDSSYKKFGVRMSKWVTGNEKRNKKKRKAGITAGFAGI